MFLPIAKSWFAIEKLDPTLYRITEPHVDPLIRAWVYLLKGRDRDLLIDGGNGIVPLRPFLAPRLDRPVTAVCTHTHLDHMGAIHEFADRLVHPLEAKVLASPDPANGLFAEDLPPELLAALARTDYGTPPPLLLQALPHEAYDPGAYRLIGAPATRLVVEGDTVDTGDRRFTVLHLPGHSPGQIALLEEATGMLFAGDAVYDGTLLYEGPGMSLDDYVATLKRLRELDVSVVHAGHGPSFDRERLREICNAYLARWQAV